jgi:transcriptional regulator with XRE-family HTH domain
MITSLQMRAARALLGIDQRQLAELSGVSLPTVQRMESSTGNVRGVVDTLTKVVEAFDRAGIELIGENSASLGGGRGVRVKSARTQTMAPPAAEAAPPPSVKLSAPPPGRRK